MDFILATLFLILYYVRPHEWNSFFSPVQPITKVLALGLAVVLFQAARGVGWRPLRFLREFLRTPNDWILLLFTLWVLHAAADAQATWDEFYHLLGYYVLIAHALSTPRRMERFLWVWMGLLLFVSIMAVLSEYEIDPFGSYGLTHGMYKGRLVLNLSIFSNPNALGHSVVMILPMIYFLGIWHRVLLLKELSLPLFMMPFWCLFWTQSKGAYISGAAGILASQTFGRPKWLQAAVLVLAYALGLSALMLLPRMYELESIRDDAGVRGRLLAWNFAWQSFETLPEGLGYGQFTQHVPVYVEGPHRVRKPTHSSYVEVGAELGKMGLYLWLGILYYALKTLVLARSETDQEERIRRLLFALTIIYMVSSWLTNISYRGTFFIQTAVIAAFARHLQRRALPVVAPADADEADSGVGAEPAEPPPLALSGPSVAPGLAGAYAVLAARPAEGAVVLAEADLDEGDAEAEDSWWASLRHGRRSRWLLGVIVDALLVYVMYRIVVRAWLYFMLDWTGI